MKLEVLLTPEERPAANVAGRAAVVIDVLRATSTIVEALANGARGIFPVGSTEDAVRLAQGIGREQVLLCGERKCLPIEGFDLGNSPREFTRERVADRTLVMATTNGTPAFAAAAGAPLVLAGAFLNLGAVADALLAEAADAFVVCAGRERRFALEDALCAGALVERLKAGVDGRLETNDGAVACALLWKRYRRSLARVLRATAAGRQLTRAGLGEDLGLCVEIDRHAVAPRLRERQLTL